MWLAGSGGSVFTTAIGCAHASLTKEIDAAPISAVCRSSVVTMATWTCGDNGSYRWTCFFGTGPPFPGSAIPRAGRALGLGLGLGGPREWQTPGMADRNHFFTLATTAAAAVLLVTLLVAAALFLDCSVILQRNLPTVPTVPTLRCSRNQARDQRDGQYCHNNCTLHSNKCRSQCLPEVTLFFKHK